MCAKLIKLRPRPHGSDGHPRPHLSCTVQADGANMNSETPLRWHVVCPVFIDDKNVQTTRPYTRASYPKPKINYIHAEA